MILPLYLMINRERQKILLVLSSADSISA